MKDREEYISILEQDNAELKKKFEEYKNSYFKLSEENDKYSIKLHKYKTQQKVFIKYLEDDISKEKEIISDNEIENNRNNLGYLIFKKNLYTEILQKYKEIIGDDK